MSGLISLSETDFRPQLYATRAESGSRVLSPALQRPPSIAVVKSIVISAVGSVAIVAGGASSYADAHVTIVSGTPPIHEARVAERMETGHPGDRRDLSRERWRSPISDPSALAALTALRQRAPVLNIREVGDPAESTAEDLHLLEEFGGLRRDANRDLA
jgi:hypothetical protein